MKINIFKTVLEISKENGICLLKNNTMVGIEFGKFDGVFLKSDNKTLVAFIGIATIQYPNGLSKSLIIGPIRFYKIVK